MTPQAHRRNARKVLERTSKRSWRLHVALIADRVERRLERRLTDAEVDRLSLATDPLLLRDTWLRFGGWLEVSAGRLVLSRELKRKRTP